MKRLTFDVLLAGTLAIAPLAWAQDIPGGGSGSMENRNDTRPTSPTRTGSDPTTTQRNTPALPGEDPAAPQRVPSEVPPAGTPTPSASPGAGTDVAQGDVALVAKVHETNQKEIRMGQLASDKAKSRRVETYARKLVSDHKAMDRELMSYARKKGLEPQLEQVAVGGTAAPQTDAAKAEADMHARLMGETGNEFDQDFVATMVDEHDRAIEMVRSARDSATDPELRKLLDKALPKLEQHRKQAQELLDKHLKS
jgi:putative membrane protein